MEFAVIKSGGKQYRVSVGDVLTIEKLPGEYQKGDKVTFEQVLLVDDGKNTTSIGTPYLPGAIVEGVFESAGKHPKVLVVKYKAKSRYLKRNGHSQPFSKVTITSIK